MKFLIRSFITHAAALFLTSWIIPGFSISSDPITFIILVAVFILANWFAKPVLKIIFLPLNLATFGLFSIVINTIILYAVAYFTDGIQVSSWSFPGFSYNGYVLPETSFGIIATYLLSGLLIGIILTIVKWILDK